MECLSFWSWPGLPSPWQAGVLVECAAFVPALGRAADPFRACARHSPTTARMSTLSGWARKRLLELNSLPPNSGGGSSFFDPSFTSFTTYRAAPSALLTGRQ
jgi:hypothetical protein